jgi:hypothetical protein
MGQKVLCRIVDIGFSTVHMFIDGNLTGLPLLGPKPLLTCRNRNMRSKFDDPIVPLDDLHLRSRLIQAMAAPQLRGEIDHAPLLHSEVKTVAHVGSLAALLQNVNTVWSLAYPNWEKNRIEMRSSFLPLITG